MALYTAQHVRFPSAGDTDKKSNHDHNQSKSKYNKRPAVRQITALAAAAAALIGGGYLGYQHYQSRERSSAIAAQPTSGELAEYVDNPFVTDPATGETHCRDTTRQEISVTAENPQTTITNPDGSTTRLTMVKFSTGEQERTQATLVYPFSAEGEAQQVPIAIMTGPSETGSGGWNMTTSPHIGRAGADIQASTTAAGPGAEAIACAPPTTSSQSK